MTITSYASVVKKKLLKLDWKWIVLIGGLLSRVVTTGTINCIGVFFDDMKKSFPTITTAQLSIVYSVAPGLLEGTGVVASLLMSRIRARYLVIVGSIVACAGILMASQTNNFFVLLTGFGIMNGIGQGLARCILPIAITFSFDDASRHKAFAILNGGDGVGGIVCPIVFAQLIDFFTWRNTLVIVAGMAANLVVSGCSVPLSLRSTNVVVHKKMSLRRFTNPMLEFYDSGPRTSLTASKSCSATLVQVVQGANGKEKKDPREAATTVERIEVMEPIADTVEPTVSGISKLDPDTNELKPVEHFHQRRSDSVEAQSVAPAEHESLIELRQRPTAVDLVCSEPQVALFPNLLFFYANILTHSVAYFIFMTFIFSDMRSEQQMPSATVSSIVAVIGGVGLLGRVSIGWMDNRRVPRWVIYMAGHLVRSVVVLGFSVPTQKWKVVKYTVLCAMYGLSDGVTGSLIPLVCVDLFGLENFGTVLGWQMFLMGMGAFIGVPLGGALRDAFNSFRIPFLFSAFSFMFAGLILMPMFWTRKRYQLIDPGFKNRPEERKFSL